MLIVAGVDVIVVAVFVVLLLLMVEMVIVDSDGSDARGGRRGAGSTESMAAYLSS